MVTIDTRPVPAVDLTIPASDELFQSQPFSARLSGFIFRLCAADGPDEAGCKPGNTVTVRIGTTSPAGDLDAFQGTRVLDIDDFFAVRERLYSIAAYGEDYYDDTGCTAQVWYTYAKLLHAVLTAPDTSEFLRTSSLGDMSRRQVK